MAVETPPISDALAPAAPEFALVPIGFEAEGDATTELSFPHNCRAFDFSVGWATPTWAEAPQRTKHEQPKPQNPSAARAKPQNPKPTMPTASVEQSQHEPTTPQNQSATPDKRRDEDLLAEAAAAAPLSRNQKKIKNDAAFTPPPANIRKTLPSV